MSSIMSMRRACMGGVGLQKSGNQGTILIFISCLPRRRRVSVNLDLSVHLLDAFPMAPKPNAFGFPILVEPFEYCSDRWPVQYCKLPPECLESLRAYNIIGFIRPGWNVGVIITLFDFVILELHDLICM